MRVMKSKYTIVLTLCLQAILLIGFLAISLTISGSSVQGVGIGQYSSQTETLYQPGTQKTYKFYLFDSPKIHASLEGDLAKYAVINETNNNEAPRKKSTETRCKIISRLSARVVICVAIRPDRLS